MGMDGGAVGITAQEFARLSHIGEDFFSRHRRNGVIAKRLVEACGEVRGSGQLVVYASEFASERHVFRRIVRFERSGPVYKTLEIASRFDIDAVVFISVEREKDVGRGHFDRMGEGE